MPVVEGLYKYVWCRIRGLIDLFLQIELLIKSRDPALWIISLLTYLGILGSMVTAVLGAVSKLVAVASNIVPRPHALPIIGPWWEHLFVSWPQWFYGLGLHGHIITGLYIAAAAYTVALIAGVVGDSRLYGFVFGKEGLNVHEFFDHLLLWLTFIFGAAPVFLGPLVIKAGGVFPGFQALLVHDILGFIWMAYSIATKGFGYRLVAAAFIQIYQIIFGLRFPKVYSDLLEEDPWIKYMKRTSWLEKRAAAAPLAR